MAGELDGGSETEQDTGEDRDGAAECKDRNIDADRHFMRKRVFRQPAYEERKQTISQPDAGERAQKR